MLIPEFWAEARIQEKLLDRQITVRRFGWSDQSPQAAQAHAEQRTREALDKIRSGAALPRREPKVPYNGAAGVPIREEIIARHEDVVITRNSYGAWCLNTPNVLFVDIDFAENASFRLTLFTAGLIIAAFIAVSWFKGHWSPAAIGLVVALLFSYWLAQLLHAQIIKGGGGHERRNMESIQTFMTSHPNWHARVYRTPLGFRVLMAHRTFDPNEQAVTECFTALGADSTYIKMCRSQNCFRARIKPKPWRIGIATHMRPRPGVWPVAPERLPARQEWIENYERVAEGYAACRFVIALGMGTVHPAVWRVQAIHDEIAKANEGLPIA